MSRGEESLDRSESRPGREHPVDTVTFAPGTLVRARGREWIVQPGSSPDFLKLRPLGGTDDEVTGLYLPIEPVEPARFEWPDPSRPGDHSSSRLLREAARLGFRTSTGPFRSFARLAVDPRPYQLVPLLMALKLDPVRMLIADDVGIGKTVESLLVAREILDRGEARGLTVLCPPHLAEQWQAEMAAKFHLEAELVLSGTVSRLERACPMGESVFERFPYTVVSTDYIKSDRRREDFLRTCPDLVIVDEAHTCADPGQGGGKARHQRHQLLKGLTKDRFRHLILVTATPHSGNEDAFRSLLSLLDEQFSSLPPDLTGPQNEPHRRRLAAHLVQRRRGDLLKYLDTDTPFPKRLEVEETYKLSPAQRQLFDDVLAYAREIVLDTSGGKPRQRVRWWSALALLRSLSSSPAAAAATLRTRASTLEATTVEETDLLGQRTVLDLADEDGNESVDVTPGSDFSSLSEEESRHHKKLLELARRAEALAGKEDKKLQHLVGLTRQLVQDGFRPIVFCRFIHTAEYLARELRDKLKGVEVVAVTGLLPPADREERVRELSQSEKRVLVATDCLSEGINLQQSFDAVIHYDLSWNPTRHEQREGRVDRYGQRSDQVRVLTYYGSDNPVDGIVLDVLLKKHKKIRSSLGISVPVPADPSKVVEALMEGLLLRGGQEQLSFEFMSEERDKLHLEWDKVTEREHRLSQTMFAQHALKVEDVARELSAVREAIGSKADVERFVSEAVSLHGGRAQSGVLELADCPRSLRDAVGREETRLTVRYELPVRENELYLNRTHPVVEGLASWVLDSSLDPLGEARARRTGVIRTRNVSVRTTLLLVRLRFHVITRWRGDVRPEQRMLAEELQLVAFEGRPGNARWLDSADGLLDAEPGGNVDPGQARELLSGILGELGAVERHLEELSKRRAGELLQSHQRVRQAGGRTGLSHTVEPQLPADLLGVYLFLPGSD